MKCSSAVCTIQRVWGVFYRQGRSVERMGPKWLVRSDQGVRSALWSTASRLGCSWSLRLATDYAAGQGHAPSCARVCAHASATWAIHSVETLSLAQSVASSCLALGSHPRTRAQRSRARRELQVIAVVLVQQDVASLSLCPCSPQWPPRPAPSTCLSQPRQRSPESSRGKAAGHLRSVASPFSIAGAPPNPWTASNWTLGEPSSLPTTSPTHSGQESPPTSSQPPAGTTLQA
jgi:hypothetical protein